MRKNRVLLSKIRQLIKIPPSGLLIREKAEEFVLMFERYNFKTSVGWPDGFNEINGICLKTLSGESDDLNVQELADD